jgi:hypothetical protein
MDALESTSLHVPPSRSDDAAASAPLIVNGLTVRPPERGQANVALYALFMPDVVALLVVIGLSMRWLAQHLNAKVETEDKGAHS